MKKIVSVFMAALLLFATFGMIAAAADTTGYTHVYTVRVAPSSEGKIRVVGIKNELNEVPEGSAFDFTIEYLGSMRPDPSVLVKCYPASYPADLVATDKDVASITLVPDANGVYSIPNVREDYYVGVYNTASKGQIANIKTMLFNFFQAFLEFFRKIFNR